MEPDCPLLEVLEAVRPHLQLTFDNILAHINTIYVLKTRQGAMGQHERYLRLKVCGGACSQFNKLIAVSPRASGWVVEAAACVARAETL